MKVRALPLYLGLALAVLLALAAALPTVTKHALHWQGVLHPWLHVLGFAMLGFFLLSSTGSLALRWVLLLLLLGFGYATEAYESHKDGWPIERHDVMLDSAGVLLGSIASMAYRKKPKR